MHDDDIETTECRECEQLLELMAGYFDGEPTNELRHDLLMHAMSCDNCTRLLHTMRRLVDRFRLEPNCEMPVIVRQELWMVLRREIAGNSGDATQA